MDGVLYDSMPHHAEAWAKASDDFGLGITRHDVFIHEGIGAAPPPTRRSIASTPVNASITTSYPRLSPCLVP